MQYAAGVGDVTDEVRRRYIDHMTETLLGGGLRPGKGHDELTEPPGGSGNDLTRKTTANDRERELSSKATTTGPLKGIRDDRQSLEQRLPKQTAVASSATKPVENEFGCKGEMCGA